MTLRDLIQLANGALDMEVVLYDRFGQRELRVNPDTDTWDYDLTKGDNALVLEFD